MNTALTSTGSNSKPNALSDSTPTTLRPNETPHPYNPMTGEYMKNDSEVAAGSGKEGHEPNSGKEEPETKSNALAKNFKSFDAQKIYKMILAARKANNRTGTEEKANRGVSSYPETRSIREEKLRPRVSSRLSTSKLFSNPIPPNGIQPSTNTNAVPTKVNTFFLTDRLYFDCHNWFG